MRTAATILLLGLFALAGAARLAAHSAPGSALLLDFRGAEVGAELRLPLSELAIAFRQPLDAAPAAVLPRWREELAGYVRRHFSVRGTDGRAWSIEVLGLQVALAEQPIDLVVRLRLAPPEGATARRFTVRSLVILHEVMNHFTVVSARQDWNQGRLGGPPELLGTLQAYAPELTIDRAEGSAWQGFRAVLMLGVRHIAEGTDHLLFLLLLVLTAPLRTAEGRWAGPEGLRSSGRKLIALVTAFTAGHSLTLVIGSLGWLGVPERWVEVLIAVSILVSAAHVLRPFLAGREPLVAAGFGLVHGLAFASALGGFQFGAAQLAAALLAFNLGIELVQIAIVAAVAPLLVVLSRRPSYRRVRVVGGLVGGTAALAWIAERALGWPIHLPA